MLFRSNVNKESVTDVDWSFDSYTGSTTDWSGTANRSNVENNKTCVVLIMNSMYYYQDSSGVASWQDLATFSSFHNVWNLGFRPDYDMYKTALLARDADWNSSNGSFSFEHGNRVRNLYHMCAYNYPEITE